MKTLLGIKNAWYWFTIVLLFIGYEVVTRVEFFAEWVEVPFGIGIMFVAGLLMYKTTMHNG